MRYDHRHLYTDSVSVSAVFVLYVPPLLAAFCPSGPVCYLFCLVWSRGPQGIYYEKAIRFRRWAADHVQSLVEGTYGRRMKAWGGIVDSLINNLMFETRDLHLRQGGGRRIVGRSGLLSLLGMLRLVPPIPLQVLLLLGRPSSVHGTWVPR